MAEGLQDKGAYYFFNKSYENLNTDQKKLIDRWICGEGVTDKEIEEQGGWT